MQSAKRSAIGPLNSGVDSDHADSDKRAQFAAAFRSTSASIAGSHSTNSTHVGQIVRVDRQCAWKSIRRFSEADAYLRRTFGRVPRRKH